MFCQQSVQPSVVRSKQRLLPVAINQRPLYRAPKYTTRPDDGSPHGMLEARTLTVFGWRLVKAVLARAHPKII